MSAILSALPGEPQSATSALIHVVSFPPVLVVAVPDIHDNPLTNKPVQNIWIAKGIV
jgi:hypothetical protein